MSSALAFSHGANDAQKAVGVIAALLLGAGKIDSLSAPTWATLACAVALTAGTALGGWRIIRTVGRRIYRLQPIEGLASQTSSAGVIFGASLLGAPTSTSQVVASSVVGIGGGRRRAPPRQLVGGPPDRARLADHDAGHGRAGGGHTRALAVADMRTKRRWFLPDTPDLIGQLRRQAEITLEGLDAFAAWAGGRRERRRGAARHRAPRRRREAGAARAAPRGLRYSAGARGPVRALAWDRLDPRLRPRPGQRVEGDGEPAGRQARARWRAPPGRGRPHR